MKSTIDRRTVLKAGVAIAAAGVVPAWAQAKPKIRFAAVFSEKDIRQRKILPHPSPDRERPDIPFD